MRDHVPCLQNSVLHAAGEELWLKVDDLFMPIKVKLLSNVLGYVGRWSSLHHDGWWASIPGS
eukprot:12930325-Prorocentrum_lima.AAC.1